MPLALNLRLQAVTPSDQLWSTFLLRAPPQFINQAPPGAQQLFLPDFSNVPHLEHVIVLTTVDVMDGVLTISSRSGNGWRDTYWRVGNAVTGVGADAHTVCDINPDVPSNVLVFAESESTQAAPQSVCLKDAA